MDAAGWCGASMFINFPCIQACVACYFLTSPRGGARAVKKQQESTVLMTNASPIDLLGAYNVLTLTENYMSRQDMHHLALCLGGIYNIYETREAI